MIFPLEYMLCHFALQELAGRVGQGFQDSYYRKSWTGHLMWSTLCNEYIYSEIWIYLFRRLPKFWVHFTLWVLQMSIETAVHSSPVRDSGWHCWPSVTSQTTKKMAWIRSEVQVVFQQPTRAGGKVLPTSPFLPGKELTMVQFLSKIIAWHF